MHASTTVAAVVPLARSSPEQAKGRTVDRRADVWAFGAVLYEMLTGQRVFGGEDVSDTLANVQKMEPAWERLPAAVPARIRQVIRACPQKNAKQRIGDMQDVRLALEGAFETAAPGTTAPAGPPGPFLNRAIPVVLSALAAATITSAALGWLAPRPLAPSVTRFFVDPPEKNTFVTFGRSITSVVVSPDGGTLAFSAQDASGKVLLWIRPSSR